jgi:hypothetical protein
MSTIEIRAELHKLIDQVDERFLKAVYLMVSSYEMKEPLGYDIDGTPRSASELTAMLDKEVEAAQRGEHITIEEFQKKSSQWGKPTR